jgi:hypothetical protein
MKRATGKSNIDIVKDYLAGERPFVQVGFTGNKGKHRNEGEKWTDADGVEWQKRGRKIVRLTKSQGDLIREMLNDKCKCGQVIRWGSKQDAYFFARTGLCENCLIDYETKLRILGVYPDYETYKVLSYEHGTLKDALQQLQSAVDFFSKENTDVTMLCNSEGFTERWKNTNQEKIIADAKLELEAVTKRFAEVVVQKEAAKARYQEATEKYKLDCYV